MTARERDDEVASQAALERLEILDTAPEPAFDALVRAAALVCGTPMALVTLIDRDRQWFKANIGLSGATETPRDVSFCAHAVLGDELFEVPDATQDSRFATNPYVTGEPDVRFYAGMPIRLTTGEHLGTLCVIDRKARMLTVEQREVLRCLAEAATHAFEGRYAREALEREQHARKEREDALRRSEDFLARTNALAGVGGWQLDLPSNTVHWSDETCRIHGFAPGHVPELSTAIDFYLPPARPVIVAAVEQAMAGGPGWDLELPLRRVDGREIWVRTAGAVERVDGQVVRLVGAFQDVTDRVTQLRAIVKANERTLISTEIAVEANRATTLSGAVRFVIDTLCAHAGWPVAHVYLQSPDDPSLLVPTGVWSTSDPARYAPFMDETAVVSLPITCAVGVLRSLAPPFSRAHSAAQCGLGAGLVAPVVVGDETVAVLEFYAADISAFSTPLVDLVGYAGIQLGRVIDRERAEESQARALAEKTAMLQEIHHRVKNNLQLISSLLSLQARRIKEPQAKAVFSEAQARVHSISLLHEVLYQSGDLGRVDMRAYVEKLVAMLGRAHGEVQGKARIEVGVARLSLPVDIAVPCGLIINELITNSLKHAFATHEPTNAIHIEMRSEAGHVVVTVADNGRGFAHLGAITNTMGMVLVRDLVAQLRGSVTFQNDHGARCSFQFSVRGDKEPS